MILLDTDHLTILAFPHSERYDLLTARMDTSEDKVFVVSIVNTEEQLRDWLVE